MKKCFVLLFCGILLTTFTPVASFADTAATVDAVAVSDDKTVADSAEPTDEALQSAILAVKGKITIPAEYSKFNYYFYDSSVYAKAYWNFSWSNPDGNAYITVTCDVDNHIIGFNKYDYNTKNSGIAKYLKSELEPVAKSFINKIAPETNGYLELTSSEYTYIYSGDYSYTYQRVYNGVAFPDNTVTVNVNSVTKEVTSVSINWLYDASIPAAKVNLTKEEAAALIKSNMKMKLVYRSNYAYIYDKISNTAAKQAYLVYEPTENYISVNAKTGEVYKTRNQWVEATSTSAMNSGAGYAKDEESLAQDSNSTVTLTEDEIKKIEELKNLISKAKAIKLITDNTSLYKDDNLTKITANLNKQEDATGKATYVWNINLSDPRETTEKDYYRGYAYATVDAQTGKILSYYASVKGYYDSEKQKWTTVKIKYDKEQSRAILEKFLNTQAKSRFTNSVLASESNDYIAYYQKDEPVYGGYAYTYNRVNKDIEYPDNYLYGAVDGVTGKIYSFSSYWNDNVTFQSPDNIISADQAMDYYLGQEGYGLKYEINQITTYTSDSSNYSVKNEIRLVYRPDISPAYISPFTGEQLNYDGTVYTKTVPYAYKDITDTEANRNILLLADMNIGFAGENFLPNQNITAGEIKELLQDVGYGYNTINTDDSKQITREEISQLFISWLGLDQLSKLNIYTTGFADEASIDKQYVGAVALAKGLGIVTADTAGNFNPKNNVTRYDAVNMIVNYITAQQKGIY